MNDQRENTRPLGREPVVWEDLTRGWCWPMLLRAWQMCLAPERLVLGVLGSVWMISIGGFISDLRTVEMHKQIVSGTQLTVHIHGGFDLVDAVYWSLILLVLSGVGVAIGRSTIERISLETRLGVGRSAWFAVQTWKVWLGAVVIQLIVLWGLFGVREALRASDGSVLMNLGYLVGAVLGVSWLVIIGFQTMIPAAVAAERSDAVDAIQRSGAYLLADLLRWLGYVVIIVVIGLVLWALLAFGVGVGTFGFEWRSGVRRPSFDPAHGVINVLVSGIAISYFYTASAMIYLLMRKAVDKQDIREVWEAPEESAS